MISVLEELRGILRIGTLFPVIKKIAGDRKGFQIEVGSNTPVSFKQLLEIGRLFGTDAIDVNGELEHGGGCETCDYTNANLCIQIYEATINIPTMFDRRGYVMWPRASDSCFTRKDLDSMYNEAFRLARQLGEPDPVKPTENCSECGRTRYGWCDCIMK